LTPLHNTEQQRELQELTRAQRRLSEQLSANRVALQELLAESAVRDIMEQVIAVLVKQLAALEKQIRAAIHAVMPSLLQLPGVGPIVAGVLLAETGDPKRFASPHHFASYCGAAASGKRQRAKSSHADQSWRQSSSQLGSSYCGYGPAPNGWRSIEEVLGASAASWKDEAILPAASENLHRS
jgi:hypothetical protein